MEGLNQHLEFQIKLAGGKTGGGSGEQSMSHHNNTAMPGFVGNIPDDIPDIGGMVRIEKD